MNARPVAVVAVVAAVAAAVLFGGAFSTRPAAPPPEPAKAATEGGGLDLRPRLVQTSLWSGSTAVGESPRVIFQARNVDADSVQSVAARFQELARFEPDGGGKPVPVALEIAPTRRATFAFTLTVSPVEPLAADAWYTLVVEEDLALVVGSAEAAPGEDRGELRSRMFTGSAPQIRRPIRNTVEGKSSAAVVDVVMSEPVQLASLVGRASVASGGRGLGGCVAWGADCVRRGQGPELVSVFSVKLDKPLSREVPDGLQVALDGRVTGRGRSVEDGARVQGRGLVTSAPASQWKRCTSEADSLCWGGGSAR